MFRETLTMKKYKTKIQGNIEMKDVQEAFKEIIDSGITEFDGGIYLSTFYQNRQNLLIPTYDNITRECTINEFSVNFRVGKHIGNVTLPVYFEYSLLWTILVYRMLEKSNIANMSCLISVDEEGNNVSWRMYARRGNETWLGDGWEEEIAQPVVLFDEVSDVYNFYEVLKKDLHESWL